MADMGLTEVQASVEERVSALIQRELIEKSFLVPWTSDFSAQAEKGVDRIKIPKAGSFAAEDKTENAALTSQVLTYSTSDLLLDQHKAILVRLEDRANLQAKPEIVADIVRRMGNELALEVDQYLVTKLEAASAAAPDHRVAYDNNPTDTIQQSDILNARSLLRIQNCPMDGLVLGVSPAQEKALLSIADFVRADTYGEAIGLRNGELGRLYGITVVVSTVFDDLKSVLWHPEAIGYARQQVVTFEQDRDLPNVATEYLMSNLFGAIEMQDGKCQVMIGTAA